jgi:nucleoside-diphosphate-sugar epimerase/predicted dehydrogenase
LDYVEIVAIADVDLPRAQDVAARFGIPLAVRTVVEMASTQPDVVHVLTPPAFHADIAIQAFEMGCHVFVEKPMAESPADCDRMIAAAQRAGRVLSVNHSARMDPVVLQALELVQKGAIGTVMAVDFLRSSDYAPYRGGPDLPMPYRRGSYPFQDLGIHGLSLFEAFLGKIQHLEVRFTSSGLDANLLLDEWRALAQCERGVGQMYLSWNVRPIQNEIFVHGTRGVIHVDCFLQTCTMKRTLPGPKFGSAVAGTLTSSLKTLWRVPINVVRFATGRLSGSPGIHVSIRRFYEALIQGSPVPILAEEGRRLIAFMEEPSRQADEEKVHWRKVLVETPLLPARFLVTGAGGFLGRALMQRLLQDGRIVRAHFRRPPLDAPADPRLQVVYGDLGDPEVVDHLVKDVDIVFHVGAATKGGAADFERGTIWGTRNVIDACLRHKVSRLVYVSSMSVLDHANHREGQRVDETWAYEPHPEKRGAYTQTKLEAEQLVLQAIRERSLPAVILRPGQIFGPGATQAPSGVIGLAGRWLVVGDGSLSIPLVYVDDVVSALLLAAARPEVIGQIFHIVTPETVSQREYINFRRQFMPDGPRVSYTPPWLLYSAGLLCEILARMLRRDLPLSRYRVRSIRPLSDFDTSAAKAHLGWIPEVGVREGLALTFRPAKAEAGVRAAGAH